ncbi:MAG: NADH-quinone oxidoreductase subunit NuoE [Candidatus Methylomirabilaceae bacterium]
MTEDTIQQILSRYRQRRSALLPLLHLYQEEAGYLTEEALRQTAECLGLAPTQVAEVASFYDMFRLKPGGRREIWVCQNLSCSLLGAEDVVRRLEEQLGIAVGDTTSDGEFTLRRVECLAACDLAPVVQVGAEYHSRVSPHEVGALLERLRGEGGGPISAVPAT